MHIVDTEFIYARVIGIMASSRETVSVETYSLMCGVWNRKLPKVVILDGCALLWTVYWPALPAKVSALSFGIPNIPNSFNQTITLFAL